MTVDINENATAFICSLVKERQNKCWCGIVCCCINWQHIEEKLNCVAAPMAVKHLDLDGVGTHIIGGDCAGYQIAARVMEQAGGQTTDDICQIISIDIRKPPGQVAFNKLAHCNPDVREGCNQLRITIFLISRPGGQHIKSELIESSATLAIKCGDFNQV